MKIEIDGEMIYDKVTGETICNIEEIDNLEQAKEIISILIEEIEEYIDENENLKFENIYLEEMNDGLKEEIEMIMENK